MARPPVGDPLHKATLRFRQHGVGIEVEVLEGVFAGAGVDAGTRHLLRWLADERFAGARSVLDVGCGYGPLALWLAAADPSRQVAAIDRDARALEACALGRARNQLDDRVEVLGSLGYDGVGDRRFDLVVSNIPAKIGAAGLRHLVLDAAQHLYAGGSAAVVVIDRLVGEVDELLADEAVEVLAAHATSGYTAFVYRFAGVPAGASSEPGFDRGVYRRGRGAFRSGGHAWEAEVAWSIAEFDTLAHGTEAAIELLPAADAGTVTILGTGQGHLALALEAAGHRGPLRLVDRDLLALRTTAANLRAATDRVEARHRSRPAAEDLAETELAVVALPEREPVSVSAALLAPALAALDGRLILHGRRADVRRVLELLRRHGLRLAVEAEAVRGRHAAVAAIRR